MFVDLSSTTSEGDGRLGLLHRICACRIFHSALGDDLDGRGHLGLLLVVLLSCRMCSLLQVRGVVFRSYLRGIDGVSWVGFHQNTADLEVESPGILGLGRWTSCNDFSVDGDS